MPLEDYFEVWVHRSVQRVVEDQPWHGELANGYLAFEPRRRTVVVNGPADEEQRSYNTTRSSGSTSMSAEYLEEWSTLLPASAPSREQEQPQRVSATPTGSLHAPLSSPNNIRLSGWQKASSSEQDGPVLSFNSVDDNLSSPRLARPETPPPPRAKFSYRSRQRNCHSRPAATCQWAGSGKDREIEDGEMGDTQSTEVPDSMPNSVLFDEFNSPGRVMQHFLDSITGDSRDEGKEQQDLLAKATNARKRTWDTIPSSSPLVPTSDSTITTSEPHPKLRIPNPTPPTRTLPRSESDPIPQPLPLSFVPSQPAASSPLSRATSFPVNPHQHPPTPRGRPPYSVTTIRAPEPPVSNEPFDASTLLTPSLAQLSSDLDLPSRFLPDPAASHSFPPRETQRGHWFVDTSFWDDSLRHSAWDFLTNYVSNGHAGWGTRVHRDEVGTWLRIYCFGKVVGEIYLLIYLVSWRGVKYVDLEWWSGGEVWVRALKRGSRREVSED